MAEICTRRINPRQWDFPQPDFCDDLREARKSNLT
jgi:hypothetical protein